MPDNATFPEGVGTSFAFDEVGGVKHQRMKVQTGADGTAVDVSATNPMPTKAHGLSGAIAQSVTTVGTSATAVPASPLANRASVIIQNVGTTTIYLGSNSVTASTGAAGGLQILPGESIPIGISASTIIYAISSAAGGLVMVLEIAA